MLYIECYTLNVIHLVEFFFLQALSFHLNETIGKLMFANGSVSHDLLDIFTYIAFAPVYLIHDRGVRMIFNINITSIFFTIHYFIALIKQ